MTSAYLLCLLSAASPGQEVPTGPALISKMLQRYFAAKTNRAQIEMVQTAATAKVTIRTDFALKVPGKLLIQQRQAGGEAKEWLSIANGIRMGYNKPVGIFGRPRLLENQSTPTGRLDHRDVFAIVAETLGDNSPVLAIFVARADYLRNLRAQWGSNWSVTPIATNSDGEAYAVRGTYRPRPGAPDAGQLTMIITSGGELRSYQTRESILVPDLSPNPIPVDTTWTVNGVLDQPIDDSVFEPIR